MAVVVPTLVRLEVVIELTDAALEFLLSCLEVGDLALVLDLVCAQSFEFGSISHLHEFCTLPANFIITCIF